MTLTVNEIFFSIQGESSFAGRPCVFIRLTGCNLRCAYCDTRYAYYDGVALDIPDILQRVADYQCPLVEVTGGEPLIQAETPLLIGELIERDFTVLLETNGTQDISRIDDRCIRIVDVKCPTSGEADKNDLDNFDRLSSHDEIKFVIGNREDYEFARTIAGRLSGRPNPVHFSPVFGRLAPDQMAAWILEDRLNVRLQPQLHKIIWNPEQRGV
ncbi:radical SAM protein [Desulfococcus multivorans]|uniref:7-carboxy-7-deazaguanine synthase n=1 Tax=Desulfococcus multivorans DSM 2059 TaxID=1121405 RepID=S7TAG8_DESML|nr:radical SAM protein [Desulfococcus multivorans]AOY60546.1 radical SAM domain protein [Desulfococcus multivorans]AQV02639.1 7-carboxy-7-deazaguanine synthase [Desulfococcus multivorans]EPR34117.1 7-carboxy-7-deazaguanine synthase [Desulfococcus multivorans DSM 2059]SKA24840.1 7-carboxy-7-deazaguanine synthase [Desulfococcus multivorans DSM 2059]